jgi:hypothetical protein
LSTIPRSSAEALPSAAAKRKSPDFQISFLLLANINHLPEYTLIKIDNYSE